MKRLIISIVTTTICVAYAAMGYASEGPLASAEAGAEQTTTKAGQVRGVVLDDAGETLAGANVYWAGTGHGTATDADGRFTLEADKETRMLVTSYMGYHNDTTEVSETNLRSLSEGSMRGAKSAPVTVVLVSDLVLSEVTITERKMAVLRSRMSAFDTQTLGTEELFKAACCNLSEAFETNPSVDVAYADAATGAKQIRLLGLSGTYVQLLAENTPGVRGLGQSFGMAYIPGTWMQSVQVSKGASSVINGYEATTGQINVEYLKPQSQKPLSINAMLNTELHPEVNLEGGWKIPLRERMRMRNGIATVDERELATSLLAHYEQGILAMDANKDGFADMPRSQNANVANRWYYKEDGYIFQAMLRGLYDHRRGGQDVMHGEVHERPYLIDLQTYRVEGFMKNGIIFDPVHGTSLGIIAAASYHDQRNKYGARVWDASQTNAYLNTIFEIHPQNRSERAEAAGVEHKLSMGLSLNYDRYDEVLRDTITSAGAGVIDLSRQELTPGAYLEYSLKVADQLSMVAGVRGDYSTLYGFFFTPRLNIRYTPWSWWAIRASAGMGYRSPNILADNASLLPSHRRITFFESTGKAAQEQAVNAGVSTTFYIPLGKRELQLTAEYYYTDFLNSVVADYDRSTAGVYFYNLRDIGGQSFAHNAQVEATMEILRGWTMTAAFRYTDVQQSSMDADGTVRLRQKVLTNRFKGLITTSYQTPLKKWQFDLTAQFNGGGRMPDGFADYFLTTLGSAQYEERGGDLYYKWYPQLMAQITKNFRTWSLYLGAENMTNFRQEAPVLGADDPFAAGFDASMAWAPTSGWKIYLGFRWALDAPE